MAYGLEKIVAEDAPIYQQVINYYKYCERCELAKRTMEIKTDCVNYFIKFSGITNLEDITNSQIDDWVDSMRGRHNAARSINIRLIQLRVMLRWQRDDNVVMPHLKISRIILLKEYPPRKIHFTREEINQALALADRREWLLIKLAFDCGLRVSELTNLRLCDIEGRKIRIVGKGRKLRYAKMSEEARVRLDDWVRRNGVTDYLWESCSHPGHPLHVASIRSVMERPFKAAGFDDFHPHTLRHSYATELKKIGVPTRSIQAVMGHASEATTERYLSDLDGFNIDEVYDVKDAVPDIGLR